ncbi:MULTISPECIES: deoxyribose-phosphate aldolase [unclassified Polaribacter]|uniref:deoxyribose-phosphate aldolase n=1 Tax=unclassified Polaribacter TaxID=196858 RepID=UPI0011BE5046|nr:MULTISPECIES: deoxyribose-phosphate aldolase [unclassified Polaribacter]TXD51372.1 deoxyribose-phosphate aldolase [Polaribacter sp. IC063]TXD62006.1 deoxyribose-phosphate aldolase [Polaribacter sp. IC066]
MKINQYLDATYLKTAAQANISEVENQQKVFDLVDESILYRYKLIMIRAKYIQEVKKILSESSSEVLIGTVIDFPEGNSSIENKLEEAKKAIFLEADELDFVINYKAFKQGEINLIKEEVIACTKLCLDNNKVVKFIIEVAALSTAEIIVISQLIKEIVLTNFDETVVKKVFVKSSTGFFKTEQNKPNGATLETIKLISENAKPLQIKAAGGVRDFRTALKMISLGVDRIGTSSAKEICTQQEGNNTEY